MKTLLLTIVVLLTGHNSQSVDAVNQARLHTQRYQWALARCTVDSQDAATQEMSGKYLFKQMTGITLPNYNLGPRTFEQCMTDPTYKSEVREPGLM